jgi:hypothetical protein
MSKVPKLFDNLSYFEDLERDSSFATKPMFGCLAVYYRGLNVAVIAADPGEKSFRNTKYAFDIWDGILLPTTRDAHSSLTLDFPDLREHPVLGKWLYLPQQTEGFEDILMKLVLQIRKGDLRLGIVPGTKQKKAKKKATAKKTPGGAIPKARQASNRTRRGSPTSRER